MHYMIIVVKEYQCKVTTAELLAQTVNQSYSVVVTVNC